MNLNCNYIVHEREDYIRQIKVYKIGLTGNIFRRMSAYPKVSKLVFMYASPHMELVENKLIRLFFVMFIQRFDRGREYFEGDLDTMSKMMMDTIIYFNNTVPIKEYSSIPVDNIKKTFNIHFGDFKDTTRNKVKVRGYIGWSFK